MFRIVSQVNHKVVLGNKQLQFTTHHSLCTGAVSSTIGCRHGGAVKSRTAEHPSLSIVPSLPVVGSMIPRHSGIPDCIDRSYDLFPQIREKFGDFVKLGIPGVGSGLHGTAYIIHDPGEMMRILKREGEHPSGALQQQTQLKAGLHRLSLMGRVVSLFERGPGWKRVRRFMQSDLLSPSAAKGYLPGIIDAAQRCSKGAPTRQKDLNLYLNDSAFDMFNMVMLGNPCTTADPNSNPDPSDVEFCRAAAKTLQLNIELSQKSLYERIMFELGIETKKQRELHKYLATGYAHGKSKIQDLVDRYNDGGDEMLTEAEQKSYMVRALKGRLQVDDEKADDPITLEEAMDICLALMWVSVDTTAALIGFHLIHLAIDSDAQDRIHREITAAMQETATPDRLSPQVFEGGTDKLPYFHAFMRESHRLRNPVVAFSKIIPEETEVHGEILPKDSVVLFDSYSKGVDKNLVGDDADVFRAERFLPEEVEQRKGTSKAFLDHPFFSAPFSQGARRCPGSRVARLEDHIFLAQLVLDWTIQPPSHVRSYKDIHYELDLVLTPRLPELQFTPRNP